MGVIVNIITAVSLCCCASCFYNSRLDQEAKQENLARLDQLRREESWNEDLARAARIKSERQAKQNRDAQIQQQKLEEERLTSLRKAEENEYLCHEIDEFIRARDNFDSENPTSYAYALSLITLEFEHEIRSYFPSMTTTIFLFYNASRFKLSESDDEQNVSVTTLTPFQESVTQVVHGDFSCACGSLWSSDETFMDTSQECENCKRRCYPYFQETEEEKVERKEEDRVFELEQAEIERVRVEKEEKMRCEMLEDFGKDIDDFIRTRKKFNCAKPKAYKCSIQLLKSEFDEEISSSSPNDSLDTVLHYLSKRDFKPHPKNKTVSLRHLTPFQGNSNHRMFGSFSCQCNKRWESAGSWKNKAQQCSSCEVWNYPYRQAERKMREREDYDDDEERKPHRTELCQKCRELGKLCMPRKYYAA